MTGREPLQRASGRLELAVELRHGRNRLSGHSEEGCAKARFPKVRDGEPFEAVLINTAGGLASGDRIDQGLLVGPGASLLATGQAAEKVYRSTGADAVLRTRVEVGDGATFLWLPQETILFDGARLDRTLEVDLAADARLLMVESLILGRSARGEKVHEGRLVDRRTIRVDGVPVWFEPLRLEGPIARLADRPALLAGARAAASLVAVGEGIAALLEPLRARLAAAPARAAAGLRPPLLVARILAADGLALRRTLTEALAVLLPALGGRPEAPTLWRL